MKAPFRAIPPCLILRRYDIDVYVTPLRVSLIAYAFLLADVFHADFSLPPLLPRQRLLPYNVT